MEIFSRYLVFLFQIHTKKITIEQMSSNIIAIHVIAMLNVDAICCLVNTSVHAIEAILDPESLVNVRYFYINCRLVA